MPPLPKPRIPRKRIPAAKRAAPAAALILAEDAVPVSACMASTGQSGAAPVPAVEISLDDCALYMNRELSLLEFQQRVLEEARDGRNKMLERVKFLSIVNSNLDEFFMVRVAALKQKLSAGSQDLSIDGKTVSQQLIAVRERLDELMEDIYDCFQRQLLPGMARHGIEIVDYVDLDTRERGRYSCAIPPLVLCRASTSRQGRVLP